MLNKKDSKQFAKISNKTKALVLYNYLYRGLTQKDTASDIENLVGKITCFDVSIILRGYGFNGINSKCLADYSLTLDDFIVFVNENPEGMDSKDLFISILDDIVCKRDTVSYFRNLNKFLESYRENRETFFGSSCISFIIGYTLAMLIHNILNLSLNFSIVYGTCIFIALMLMFNQKMIEGILKDDK